MQTQRPKPKADGAEATKLIGQAFKEVADKTVDFKIKATELDAALNNQVALIASVAGYMLSPYLDDKKGKIEADVRSPGLDSVEPQ